MNVGGRRIRIPADLDAVGQAGEFVAAMARAAGLGDDAVHQCELAVDEACTNIIEHGYDHDRSERFIEVVCEQTPEHLIIRLLDDSPPYNPLERPDPDPTADLEQRGLGGWGIYFIKRLMDEVRYAYVDGHNRLEMFKRLPNPSTKRDG